MMKNSLRMALLALCVFMWLPGQAYGQGPQCGPRHALIDMLGNQYKEQPVSRGVTGSGALLEVWASDKGSWSILVTVPGGPTCLVSSGDGWRTLPVKGEDSAV